MKENGPPPPGCPQHLARGGGRGAVVSERALKRPRGRSCGRCGEEDTPVPNLDAPGMNLLPRPSECASGSAEPASLPQRRPGNRA